MITHDLPIDRDRFWESLTLGQACSRYNQEAMELRMAKVRLILTAMCLTAVIATGAILALL